MRKTSSEGKICTYCDRPATLNSDPPMCALCRLAGMNKKAALAALQDKPTAGSLKELLQ